MTSLDLFQLNFRETFPAFVRQPLNEPPPSLFFNDTRTVAILGLGKRFETIITAAAGDGTEGEPINFDIRQEPSGRFFKTDSYPVDPNHFEVYRGLNGQERVPENEFLLDPIAGYFILYTALQAGERLRVRYISQADINFPRTFTRDREEALYQIYGEPSQENTLSAGAEIAFANGAARIVAVQGDHTGGDPFWFNAYSALENLQVYMIVPMQNGTYSQQVSAGALHVQNMSDTESRKERMLIVGENPTTDSNDFDSLPRSAVTDFNLEERVIFVAADYARTVIAGETTSAYGGYLAAAVAGKWSSYEYIPTSLLNKDLARILLDWPQNDLYTEKQKNNLIDQGLALLLRKRGASSVGGFVTTLTTGNPVEIEPSIWRIRDYVAITIRQNLENAFVGEVVTTQILNDVKDITVTTLKSLISQNIITKFQGVRVRADEQEPRQVNVGFDIQPVFPLINIVTRITVVSSL